MTKDDRQFITGLFQALNQKIDGVEGKLMTEVRRNGVLIEQNTASIEWLVESNQTMNDRLTRVEDKVDRIEENTTVLPAIRMTLKNHGKRLTALEAA